MILKIAGQYGNSVADTALDSPQKSRLQIFFDSSTWIFAFLNLNVFLMLIVTEENYPFPR